MPPGRWGRTHLCDRARLVFACRWRCGCVVRAGLWWQTVAYPSQLTSLPCVRSPGPPFLRYASAAAAPPQLSIGDAAGARGVQLDGGRGRCAAPTASDRGQSGHVPPRERGRCALHMPHCSLETCGVALWLRRQGSHALAAIWRAASTSGNDDEGPTASAAAAVTAAYVAAASMCFTYAVVGVLRRHVIMHR